MLSKIQLTIWEAGKCGPSQGEKLVNRERPRNDKDYRIVNDFKTMIISVLKDLKKNINVMKQQCGDIYMYIYTHTYIHIHTCIYVYMYTYIHIHVHILYELVILELNMQYMKWKF